MSVLNRLIGCEKAKIVSGYIRDKQGTDENQVWITRFLIKSVLIEWLLGLTMLSCLGYGLSKLGGEQIDWPGFLICCLGFVVLYFWISLMTLNIDILFTDIKRWRWSSSLYPILTFSYVCIFVSWCF